ncbi:MAG: hypothetical protein SGI87_09355 [Flavobacteriales bacterium]|nr:hypothetical protein [Flavobacteriales bacterium]
MSHCLTKQELREFIEVKFSDKTTELEGLTAWIEYAENWQEELCIFNYLLCCVLESKVADGQECHSIIENAYYLCDTMFLTMQELDYSFIDFMLKHLRQDSVTSLEEELISLQENWSQFIYDKANRY